MYYLYFFEKKEYIYNKDESRIVIYLYIYRCVCALNISINFVVDFVHMSSHNKFNKLLSMYSVIFDMKETTL